ncbi:MAG: LamG-like jellyroll fold domain-containing protein [Phycisphaeraceae bacterium]
MAGRSIGVGRCQIITAAGALALGGVMNPARAEEPWSFVTIPDFLNNDVASDQTGWFGDGLDGTFDDGTYAALPYVIDRIAGESPDFVLVPGDLVQGRWSLDRFDDVTVADRQNHIRTMANRFYPDWTQWWDDAGLDVYTVPGDHEFGDNPWNKSYDSDLIPVYREVYEQHLQMPDNGPVGYERRAFSLNHKNLTLVGVDMFETDSDGDMRIGVTGEQLNWFEQTLADSDTDHRVVMGHAPVLPGWLQRSSSGLSLPGGAQTGFWEAMAEHAADLYLAGEVHDVSIQEQDQVLQVITGSQPSNVSDFNYLKVTVHDDRLELEIKQLLTTIERPRDKSLDPYGVDDYTQRQVKLTQEQHDAGFQTIGTMVIDKSTGQTQYLDRDGVFQSRYTDLDGNVAPIGQLYYDFDNDNGATTAGIRVTSDTGEPNASGVIRGNGEPLSFATDVPDAIAHRSTRSLDLRANAGDSSNNQYIQIDSPAWAGATGDAARTLTAWIKTDHKGDQVIVGNGQSGIIAGKLIFRLDETQSGSDVWALRTEIQGDALVGSTDLSDGEWHHVAFVFDPDGDDATLANARLYVDGQEELLTTESNRNYNVETLNQGSVLIGGWPGDGGRFFEGLLDEVGFWGRALTADEVAALAAGEPIPEPASLTLLGLGGLTLLARRRRRLDTP